MITQKRRRTKFLEGNEELFFNAIETVFPYEAVTEYNALEIFPEGKSILARLIKDTKQEMERVNGENLPLFDASLERIYGEQMEDYQKDLAVALSKFWHLDQYLDPLREKLQRYEKILKLHSLRQAVQNSPDEVNEITIRNAKGVMLEEVLVGEKPNHAGFIRCPFHHEKTASCKISKNRFHCFGCGADGDVIDWLMKTEGKNFLTAVRELNRRI